MNLKLISAGVGAVAVLLAGGPPARAATILLNNIGGVTPGSDAYQGFTTAANFWGSLISNPITIDLNVGFGHLGPSILGQTQTKSFFALTQDVEQQIIANGASSLDAIAAAHLPTMTPGLDGVGAISMITPGYNHPDGTGVNTALQVWDNNGTFNNEALTVSSANLKALGFPIAPTAVDGTIAFSSDFKFDFNPRDGIDSHAIDFVGVAIHEIGHALGFDSGVDIYDLIGSPSGIFATGHPEICGVNCEDYPSQADAFGSPLDLFRYGADPANLSGTGSPALTWAPGVASYFSVDGGATNLCNFATGEFNGDGWQASHWGRLAGPGGTPCGIMDPAVRFGQLDAVTALDFAAFDAIGYNFTFGDQVHGFSTADISREFALVSVPEPGAWALMLVGFGLGGAVLRRRRGLLAA